MQFKVYYRKKQDGKVPDRLNLKDEAEYEEGPEVEAESKGLAANLLHERKVESTQRVSALNAGDVLQDYNGVCWVLTKFGFWIRIEANEMNRE